MNLYKLHGPVAAVTAATAFFFAGQFARAQGVPLHDGLIGYWALNEGSGSTALDTAPSGVVADNGILRNSPTWITSGGPFNTGLHFNGIDQSVLIPNSIDMDIGTNAVTLSTWFKLDMMPAELADTFGGIFDSVPDNYVLYLDRGNNELRFKATNANNVTTVAAQHPGVRAALLNTTDWHHVMGVYDGDRGMVQIYFNGELADVTTQASPVAQLLLGPVRAGQTATIGADAGVPLGEMESDTPSHRWFFPGAITDVAVWNRALGIAEAQYLHNNGAGNAVGAANPVIEPAAPLAPLQPAVQPVIYYPFDGDLKNHGTGGAALDAVLQGAGVNENLFTPAHVGQGLDLRQNPVSSGTGGDWLAVDYTLPDQGTIALRFTADKFYNFQSLWDNSGGGNDWEMWIYVDGRAAARAHSGTPIVAYNINLEDDPMASHHYAFTWERDGDQMLVRLYVNGEWVDERLGPWRDPGETFYIGGGHASNHVGSGIWDEFRIYDVALSESEILYLARIPEPASFAMAGLGVMLVGLCGLRRRASKG